MSTRRWSRGSAKTASPRRISSSASCKRSARASTPQFDVPVAGYVVNRVLPEDLLKGEGVPPYITSRIEMQRRYLGQIERDFGDDVLAHVPELERDVTGLGMIERLAGIMYGQGEQT